MSPNDFGRKFIVEECGKIKLTNFLKQFRGSLKEAVLNSAIEAMGIKIEMTTSQTGYGGIRYWFKCPFCRSRVGVLFRHPLTQAIGCRICLNLSYKKSRYKGMVETSIL